MDRQCEIDKIEFVLMKCLKGFCKLLLLLILSIIFGTILIFYFLVTSLDTTSIPPTKVTEYVDITNYSMQDSLVNYINDRLRYAMDQVKMGVQDSIRIPIAGMVVVDKDSSEYQVILDYIITKKE